MFLLITLISSIALATPPAWLNDSSKLQGSHYQVACSGEGPSVDIARAEALNSCRSSANDQLKSTLHIKNLSLETENDVGWHSEVSQDHVVKNLTCDPKKESVDQSKDQFQVWILCDFNLKQVEVKEVDVDTGSSSSRNSVEGIKDPTTPVKIGRYVSGTSSTLNLSTIPKCDSILIRGQRPRVITCATNPVSVVTDPNDQEIIIRAKGYLPKTFSLRRGASNDSLQVFLDPM